MFRKTKTKKGIAPPRPVTPYTSLETFGKPLEPNIPEPDYRALFSRGRGRSHSPPPFRPSKPYQKPTPFDPVLNSLVSSDLYIFKGYQRGWVLEDNFCYSQAHSDPRVQSWLFVKEQYEPKVQVYGKTKFVCGLLLRPSVKKLSRPSVKKTEPARLGVTLEDGKKCNRKDWEFVNGHRK
jgi:hypothetical protein